MGFACPLFFLAVIPVGMQISVKIWLIYLGLQSHPSGLFGFNKSMEDIRNDNTEP